MLYKVLEASSPYDSHAFEEIESKINVAAKDGYRLKANSIQVFYEDRGPSQMTVCRVVATMSKKDTKKKSRKKKDKEVLP